MDKERKKNLSDKEHEAIEWLQRQIDETLLRSSDGYRRPPLGYVEWDFSKFQIDEDLRLSFNQMGIIIYMKRRKRWWLRLLNFVSVGFFFSIRRDLRPRARLAPIILPTEREWEGILELDKDELFRKRMASDVTCYMLV